MAMQSMMMDSADTMRKSDRSRPPQGLNYNFPLQMSGAPWCQARRSTSIGETFLNEVGMTTRPAEENWTEEHWIEEHWIEEQTVRCRVMKRSRKRRDR
jgi:hypothetical protein